MSTLSQFSRSHPITSHKFQVERDAKATTVDMFSVARRSLQKYVYWRTTNNPATLIKTFSGEADWRVYGEEALRSLFTSQLYYLDVRRRSAILEGTVLFAPC